MNEIQAVRKKRLIFDPNLLAPSVNLLKASSNFTPLKNNNSGRGSQKMRFIEKSFHYFAIRQAVSSNLETGNTHWKLNLHKTMDEVVIRLQFIKFR